MSFSNKSRLVLPVSVRDHLRGSPAAPIVIVEYGDYECPNCVDGHRVMTAVQRSLGDRLCFVFRHFPLTSAHTLAQAAAECTEAAGSIGLFWEMHDAIFERRSPLSKALLFELGYAMGLDRSALERDLTDGTFTARVQEDFMSGVRSGANGTPTFFVNDRRYDGFADYDSLMTAVDTLFD